MCEEENLLFILFVFFHDFLTLVWMLYTHTYQDGATSLVILFVKKELLLLLLFERLRTI